MTTLYVTTPDGLALHPSRNLDVDLMFGLDRDREYKAKLVKERSNPFNRKLHAVMQRVWESTWLGDHFTSKDLMRNWVSLEIGHVEMCADPNKGVIYRWPKSTDFKSTDADEFNVYYERAIAFLAEQTGIDPEELRKDA